MLAALAAPALSSMFAGVGGSGGVAAEPDTVTVDTGDVTPTMGGAMTNASSSSPWLLYAGLGLAVLLLSRRI